jgi:hypothetical protein
MRDQMYRWELRFVPLEEAFQWRRHSGSLASPREFDSEAIFPTGIPRMTPPTYLSDSPDYFSYGMRPGLVHPSSAPVVPTSPALRDIREPAMTSPVFSHFPKLQIHSPPQTPTFFQAALSPRQVQQKV